MMNHDPFQSYQTGAYPVGTSPYGLPYTALQQFINPGAFGGYGMNPQQQHQQGGFGIGQSPFQQNPYLQSQNPYLQSQNPYLQSQNPYLQSQNPLLQNPILQNPLVQQALLQQLAWQNQLLNPALTAHGWPQQQQQFGGYPLGPQGLIGGGGIGQIGGIGQLHPLAQLALRQASGYGVSPYGGGF